jgi:Contact-dependent growth inhibition CdiA C-terminal domain
MNLERSQNIYNSFSEEYERYYFDENTGGFVVIHQNHQTTESERFIARILAQNGKQVKLLNEQAETGVKIPDAEVNGVIYEFKELTEESQILGNRIQEGIGQARKQGATAVVYYINRSTFEIWQINRGIRQAFFWDRQEKIQEISLLFRDGKLETITREEWENGKYF